MESWTRAITRYKRPTLRAPMTQSRVAWQGGRWGMMGLGLVISRGSNQPTKAPEWSEQKQRCKIEERKESWAELNQLSHSWEWGAVKTRLAWVRGIWPEHCIALHCIALPWKLRRGRKLASPSTKKQQKRSKNSKFQARCTHLAELLLLYGLTDTPPPLPTPTSSPFHCTIIF